jgi:hypothetical protein
LILLATLVGCVAIQGVPTSTPGSLPTLTPSAQPTPSPTPTPTPTPTAAPTPQPTGAPTDPPTSAPTDEPAATNEPAATGPAASGASPLATELDLRPFLTSGVTVFNVGDEPLSVATTIIDPESGDEFDVGTSTVAPSQFTRQAAIPLRFKLVFSYPNGSSSVGGTCTIDVADKDEIDFIAAPSGIVVIRNQVQPDDLAAMVVGTAPDCMAGEPS